MTDRRDGSPQKPRWQRRCTCGAKIRNRNSDECAPCRSLREKPSYVDATLDVGVGQRSGKLYNVLGVLMSSREIAEMVGVSKDAIYQRVSSGTPLLARRLRG